MTEHGYQNDAPALESAAQTNMQVAKSTASAPVIYMCCNLVQDQLVSETRLPVLRTFRISRKDITDGDGMHHITFSELQWKPVRLTHFRQIDIYFLDHTLRPVKFRDGHSQLTVQFKQIA